MLNLDDIEQIKIDRNEEELQTFIMFAVAVAGKTAKTISNSLNYFFHLSDEYVDKNLLPFDKLKILIKLDKLDELIKRSGLGQHKKLSNCFRYLASNKIDLKNCTIKDLELIPGISFKTSRFFILFNRENVKCAVLDRHILAEMKSLGFDVPKNTPQNSKVYTKIEKQFINYAESIGKTPSSLDLEIWKKRSKNDNLN